MHNKPPRVSIVVPAFNESAGIRDCLQAIARQTVLPYEVIVVDNNSADSTAEIARSFPFVRVITESRQGRVYARNAGFHAARGEVIARIDADIVMPRDWVAHITHFYTDPVNAFSALTGTGRYYNIPLPDVATKIFRWVFGVHRALTGSYPLWGSSMALTRAQWQHVSPAVHTRTDIHEDLDLALHISEAGYTVVYKPELQVDAELRRVFSDRQYLWQYLQWYPRALRLHKVKVWPVCWVFGVLGLYALVLLWLMIDACIRMMSSPVLGAHRD